MTIERRLHPRAVVKLPAEILPSEAAGWERALLHDLSAGGAGVYASAGLPLQSEVRLRFSLPGNPDDAGHEFELLCLVVRTEESGRPDSTLPILLGLHFLTLHGEEFEFIRRWIWFRLES
jgi:c-di-GMP-binding flagellar brake protein YcgR